MKTIKLYKKLKKFGDGTSDVTEGTDTLGGTPKGENFAKGVGAANAGIQIANMGYQMLGEKGDEFGVKSDAGAIGGGALSGAAMGAGLGSIAGPWGCVCTGTKVITNLGEFKNVEDLKQEDGIIGWNGSEYIQQNIVGFQPPAQKECLEIETGLGHKLRCSIDHPIYSSGQGRAKRFYVKGIRTRIKKYEYIDAENLKIGDNIGLINEIPIWGAKVMAIPYLVGACIGDGTYGKNKGVRLTTGDSDTWEYIESNDLGYQIDKKNTDLKYNKEFRIYRLKNTIEVFRKLGIYEQTKENKRLPDNIHLYNKDSICKLIAGLIDTDGYVSFNSKKPRNGKIGFCQSNIELIKQVREQLTKLGIHSSLKTNKATKKVITDKECNIKEAYILLIKDKYSVINFYNNISLNISYKKNNLKALYNHINECGTKDHKEHTNVCADKIIKITPIGLQDIYNLEAAGSHTYIANLIITHNTAIGGVVGGLAGGIKGFIDNKASKEAAEEYQKRQLQLQVQGDKDKWQQTLASGFKVQGNEYATKYAKYGGLLYKKMGDDGKFKPNTESEVDNTKILRNYELPQKFNSQGLRTNLVGNRTGNEIKKDFGKTGTGEIEESISPMDIVGGVKAIGYGAKLTKSIVSDLTKGVVRRLNPKNLKVEKTASDWMKERYSDPSVLKKIEKYKENNKQGFISVTDEKKQNFDIDEYLNMGKNPSFKLDKKDVYINNPSKVKFEDANYIDLLKNKGLKQYVEKSISSKGVSYGDPKTYTNRTSFFPFDKKGKEGVKVHENTHALTTNGRAFNKENDDLLKPFGETHESYQNKFSNQKLGHNEKYYLDPTEIHARLNQSRYELKHSPNQKYTLEDLENSLSSNNLNGMGKYIKDKNAFVDMANKMYTIPAVITSGSAISKYKEKEMGGIIYNSQNKKSLYKNGGNVQQLSKNSVEFQGNSHEMGGIKEPVVNGRVLEGAEVENEETMQGNFIFSEELGFAQKHKPLAKMVGKLEKRLASNPGDKITKSTIARINSQIEDLKHKQEETKEVLGIENDSEEMKNGGLYKKMGGGGKYVKDANNNQSYTDASGTYAITGKNNTLRYKGLKDKDFRTINDPNGIAAINKLNPSFQYTPSTVASVSTPSSMRMKSSEELGEFSNYQKPLTDPGRVNVDDTTMMLPEGSTSKTSVNWGNVASGLTPYLGVAANYMLNEKAKKLKLPQEKLTTPISLQRVNYDNQRAEADIQRGQLNTLTNRNLTNSAVASAVMAKNLGTTIRQKNAINESEMNANRMISNEEATRNKTIEQYNNTTQVGNEDRFYNRDRDYLQNKGQIATNLSSMIQKQRADKMQYDLEDRKIEATSKADAGRDAWLRNLYEEQKKANAAHALTTTEEVPVKKERYGGKVKSSLRKKVGC